jgi:lipopolysaccharide biosynthesis protein
VSGYVYYYLESLRAAGFEILFISNSPVKTEFRERLLAIPGCLVHERENKGADFGAWKWAIQQKLIPSEATNILLTNDSIFGPLFDLTTIVNQMNAKNVDFWGLTDTFQVEWHIQSYFLHLSRKVFSSEAFQKIFRQDFDKLDRNEIITKGEIRLSQVLKEAGFRSEVFVVIDNFPDKKKNPTHYHWKELIERFKFPFVKKDLLTKNPEQFHNVMNVFQVIEEHSTYDINLIMDVFTGRIENESVKSTNLRPLILCHIFFPDLAFEFIGQLMALIPYQPVFIFNLSATLSDNKYFRSILRKTFPGCIIVNSPNKGRDIGGKLFALNLSIQLGIESDVILVIHDKKSQHLGNGELWRDELFRVIEKKYLPTVFDVFKNKPDVGIVCSGRFIQNEYNSDKRTFYCTSNKQIKSLLEKYAISSKDYDFVAGNIFWIRTKIVLEFFKNRPLFDIRGELETGNALDFGNGTFIHSWERIMSWIATSQEYQLYGI